MPDVSYIFLLFPLSSNNQPSKPNQNSPEANKNPAKKKKRKIQLLMFQRSTQHLTNAAKAAQEEREVKVSLQMDACKFSKIDCT